MRRNKMNKWLFLIVIGVSVCVPANHAAAETMPHTFSAGSSARSAEINSNFQFVNHGNIVLVDANGVELGSYLSSEVNSANYNTYHAVLNDNGYIVRFGKEGNITNGSIYFTGSNCTGEKYIDYAETENILYVGVVFKNTGSTYYIPAGTNSTSDIFPLSWNNSDGYGCRNITGVEVRKAILAKVNEIAVTGESGVSKLPPFRLKRKSN